MRSGISRGPLYHHFKDFDDLIATAHSQIYRSSVDQFTNQLLTEIKAAEDGHAAKHTFIKSLTESLEENTASQRRVRLGVLHGASSSPTLRGEIATIQEGLNRRWMQIHQICVEKGWCKLAYDSETVAILIQSTFLGRVLDDMALTQMNLQSWIQTLTGVFEHFFLDNAF